MMYKLSDLQLNAIQIHLPIWLSQINTAWLVLVISSLVLFVASFMLLRSRNRLEKHLHEIRNIQHDIRAITAAAIGVGERVLELERRQRRLSEKQEQYDNFDPANMTYEQAISMVQHGADVQELVDICGISESEAELVALMHRLDQTA
jgi:Flp pilus assembly protein TadB